MSYTGRVRTPDEWRGELDKDELSDQAIEASRDWST